MSPTTLEMPNPLVRFAQQSLEVEIFRSLLEKYRPTRLMRLTNRDEILYGCKDYMKFYHLLQIADEGTQSAFQAAASRLANTYLDSFLLAGDGDSAQNIHNLATLFYDANLRVDISKVLTALKVNETLAVNNLPGVTVYDMYGCEEPLRYSLLDLLKQSQRSASPEEKTKIEKFWTQEIKKPQYADSAFWGLIALNESKTSEWYEIMRTTFNGKVPFEIDMFVYNLGLDEKYRIQLTNANEFRTTTRNPDLVINLRL